MSDAAGGTNALDLARDTNREINEMLADTDGRVCAMALTGRIGYHVNIAEGETNPEYLWKVAFLQALDRAVLDMAHVDGVETARDTRNQLEHQIGEKFDTWVADELFDNFEENLAELMDAQADA